MNKTVFTQRLSLRPISDADSANMIRILRDNTVNKTYMIPDLDEEAAQKLFIRFRDMSADPQRYVRGVYLQDSLIGWINDQGVESGKMELGWVIDPAYSNCGYCSEAAAAAVKELFAWGIQVVSAGAFSENLASIRVMEKIGMHPVEFTEEIEYRGKTHKCVYYEIENV